MKEVCTIFLLVLTGLSMWYLTAYCFDYSKKKCHGKKVEKNTDCQIDATYIAFLSIFFVISSGMLLGMVSIPKVKKYRKRRR
jgi:hypothetical protein